MTKQKLEKLRRQLETLRRRGGIKTRELENFAKALGRKRHKRGKEPNWISEVLPDSRPVSIPGHSVDLNKYTARSILDQLEEDIEKLEELIADEGDSNESKEEGK